MMNKKEIDACAVVGTSRELDGVMKTLVLAATVGSALLALIFAAIFARF